jgi:hypothetical protein
MTRTPPPPPKHGGSGPFIIAALIMLLLMGGLIYWKLGSNDPKPSARPTPSAAPTTAVLDEPPPPPPPPEEPKEDAGAPSKQAKRGVVSTGCSGTCTGEAPGNLRSMLAAKGGQARGCYERALRQNNMLQGRLRLSLRIGQNGSVCSANVAMNELGDPGVASCVVAMFRATTYPNPQGGCVDVDVPLKFEPRK